jgi:hypothetical protein
MARSSGLPVCGVALAGYIVVFRRFRLSALLGTAIGDFCSAAIYVPIYVMMLSVHLRSAPLLDIIVQTVYLGRFATVLGFVAFNRAVTTSAPSPP